MECVQALSLMWWLWFRRRRSFGPPAPDCDAGPDGLYESKRPSSLKETVSRSQDARASERQDVPMAPLFKCIEDQHRRYCNQSKDSQSIHFRNLRFSRAVWNTLPLVYSSLTGSRRASENRWGPQTRAFRLGTCCVSPPRRRFSLVLELVPTYLST